MTDRSFKITVTFERREDGGLRAWSEDVPGLVLSNADVDGVLEDVTAAIEVILSARLHRKVAATPLGNIREALEADGIVDPAFSFPGSAEYVAYVH